ncbi:hypothetical protein RJ55_02631 [Drechmeria coniospora]|nr:hypothetical protein RJ55_02631 [Drechmeria coniospora]
MPYSPSSPLSGSSYSRVRSFKHQSSFDSSPSSSIRTLDSSPSPSPSIRTLDSHGRPATDDMFPLAAPRADDGHLAPALPAKSALRASRLLATLPRKNPASDVRPMLPHAAPHPLYLSSEEDASSSADDSSDFDDLDTDSQPSPRSPPEPEDTARLVTLVFRGRPQLVELRRAGAAMTSRPVAGLVRTSTEPTFRRTRVASSSSTSSSYSLMPMPQPTRSSSGFSAGAGMRRPNFLAIDPYPAAAAAKAETDEHEAARTPRTPTAMFKKTLNLVKKRSKPALHHASTGSTDSRSSMEQVAEGAERRPSLSTNRASANYHDVVRSARGTAEAAQETAASAHRSRFRSGLSISRPRSVRA